MKTKITCWRCKTVFDVNLPRCTGCRLLGTWADSSPYQKGYYDGRKKRRKGLRQKRLLCITGKILSEKDEKSEDEAFMGEGYERGYLDIARKHAKELLKQAAKAAPK